MKVKLYKKTKKEFFVEIIYILLIFQIALQSNSNYIVSKVFNYVDDVIALCCLVYIALCFLSKRRVSVDDRKILIMYILFAIIGVAGSVVTKIQSPLTCVSDLFTCSKFILGYLATRLYFKGCNPNLLKRSVSTITKLLVVIFFVLAIHDEFMTPFFGIFDNRLFGKSIELFYPHPTYLAAACIVFLLVLATTNGPENNIIYMVMASTIIVFTFRAKAISFVAVFWGLYLMIDVWKIKNKIIYVTVSAILAGYLAYDQFITYFMSKTWSARAVLFTDAITVAKRYFPIGAGFASFGTNMSVVSYSPLYYAFGYNNIEGMSKSTAAYLNDGFWQACIAQFGALGVVLFVFLIYFFMKKTWSYKIQNVGATRYFSLIALNIYLVIASIGELAYFAPYALLYFAVLGIVFDENDEMVSRVGEDI